MTERVVELTDAMLDAGAAALDQFDGPIPADRHERWGVVSLILVAALREAPYPASRPEPASVTVTMSIQQAEGIMGLLSIHHSETIEAGYMVSPNGSALIKTFESARDAALEAIGQGVSEP